MTELYKAIYIISFAITLYLIICLKLRNRQLFQSHQKKLNNAVILFLSAMIVIPMHAYYRLVDHNPPFLLLVLAHSLVLIYGPLVSNFVYLLIQSSSGKSAQQSAFTWFVPFIPFIAVLFIKFLQLSYDKNIMMLIFFLLPIFYLFYTSYLIVKNRQKLGSIYSGFKNSSYYWLLFVVFFLFFLVVFDMFVIYAFKFQHYHWLKYWHLMVVLTCAYLAIISLMYAYQPAWFDFNRTESEIKPEESKKPIKAKEESKDRDCLNEDLASILTTKLYQLLNDDKIYLNNNLTLSHLSELLSVNNQIVTELLNKNLNTAFYELLNTHRFEHAKELLSQKNHSLSIIDIAFEAGFNNKNTFYRVFKQHTGLTPSCYRKQHL